LGSKETYILRIKFKEPWLFKVSLHCHTKHTSSLISGAGGSFTGDTGGCVKEGSGDGHFP